MRRTWTKRLQRLGHRVGLHVTRWRAGEDSRSPLLSDHPSRRLLLLDWLRVEVLFDVGANTGQYATSIRSGGFEGQIVSFEPLATAFAELEAASQDDPRWAVCHMGLGETAGEAEINVSRYSPASSILPVAEQHLALFPGTEYVDTEKIRLETLDSASAAFLDPSSRAALKMDVQGYEMNVLRGGTELLRRAVFVESEIALVELYQGQARVDELINTLYGAGLRLASIEPGYIDERTGAAAFCDAIFIRVPEPGRAG